MVLGALIAAVVGAGAAAVATNVELLSAPSTTTIERASEVLITENNRLDPNPIVEPAPNPVPVPPPVVVTPDESTPQPEPTPPAP